MGFKDRHDFRSPPRPRFGLDLDALPTPNVADSIITDTVVINVANYEPVLKGTPHPQEPTALLVFEETKQSNLNELEVTRVYATSRVGQDTYNASIKFLEAAAAYPIYVRSYVLERPWTPATRDAPLSSLVGIHLTNGGSGYAAEPVVSFTGGAGTGATAQVELELLGGVVVAIWLTDGGTAFTSAPTVVFTPAGNIAAATANLSGTSISGVVIQDGGSGYTEFDPPLVTAVGGGGSGAVLTAQMTGDFFSGVSIVNGGSGYTSPPDIVISYGPASGTATLTATTIASVSVDDGGTLYSTAPTVTISGDGTGATATATIASGVVTGITLTSPGSDYTSATVSFSGGHAGTGAAATALIQPQTALLTDEQSTPAEGRLAALFDRVTRVYTTLSGPVVTAIKSATGGLFIKTTRQMVLPGTLPSTPSGVITADEVRQISTTEAERVTTSFVDSAGTTAAGFPTKQTLRIDDRTGVVIYTDHFIAPKGYNLPAVYVGGTQALIAANYPSWKQPNANNIGPSNNDYSPKHYVIDARAQSFGDDSDLLMVEVEHAIIPLPSVEIKEVGYTFPGLFFKDEDAYFIPNNYGGNYPPPWPIGEKVVGGYRKIAPRPSRVPAVTYVTYSLGPIRALPPTYQVVTPGVASKLYGRYIGERTIHSALSAVETLSDGSTQQIEDIPTSTPSSYNPYSILVIAASEKTYWGEIYRQEVTVISESLPVSAFPDPVIHGFYTARKVFSAQPQVLLDAKVKGQKIYAITTGGGSESVVLTVFGKATPTSPNGSQSEQITAAPTISGASATTLNYSRVQEIVLAAPTATDSVLIYEQIDPDYATLLFTAQPVDGDVLVIGLTGSKITYRYRQFITPSTLDGIFGASVTAPGTGYTTNPAVTFGGATGSGATGTTVLVGTTIASIAVNSIGSGYGGIPTVAITGGGGSGATATANLTGNTVTSYTLTNGGSGYTTAPQIVITPTVGGSGAAAHAVFTATGVASIAMTARGSGYTSPTATITGGAGSGATATATLDAHLIKIGSTLANTASNSQKAIMGTGLDQFASADGANADVTSEIDSANARLLHFYGSNPTTAGGNYSGSGIFESDGTTPETFGTFTAFVSGSVGQILATIPPGLPYAYFEADFSSNANILTDQATDNDRKAIPTLPAGQVFYTDWMQIPAGKPIKLSYAATGSPPLRVAYQKSSNPTVAVSLALTNGSATTVISASYVGCDVLIEGDLAPNRVASTTALARAYQGSTGTHVATISLPQPVAATVGVTNGSTVVSGLVSGDVGKAIFISGDTSENEVITGPALLRAYTGGTGSKAATLIPLVATTIATAASGKIRNIDIGIPATTYIRLKITRTGLIANMNYRPVYAAAEWQVNPNDNS